MKQKITIFSFILFLTSIKIYGGIRAEVNGGYGTGSFVSRSVTGPKVSGLAGANFNFKSFSLGLGGYYSYMNLTYSANSLSKFARWYYQGVYFAGNLLTSPGYSIGMRVTLPFDSRLFVNSKTNVSVNGSTATAEENSRYNGGSGQEIAFSFLSLSKSKKGLRGEKGIMGLEIPSLSQSFTKRKQRTSVAQTDEETYETIQLTNGSFDIQFFALSFVIGAEF